MNAAWRQHIGEWMQMITFAQCAAFAGLCSNEIILGATPSARHYSLLASYLLNLGRGPMVVRDMIVSDLRSFLDLGATQRAADLLIVLRIFLSDYPQARYVRCRLDREEDIAPIPFSSNLRGQNEVRIRSQEVGDCVLKKGLCQEMSSGFGAKVVFAEDDFDASVGEEEEGVILLSSRRITSGSTMRRSSKYPARSVKKSPRAASRRQMADFLLRR